VGASEFLNRKAKADKRKTSGFAQMDDNGIHSGGFLTVATGKQRGLRALCDERGVLGALAIDQRDALRKLFAKATGLTAESIPAKALSEFNEHVSKILTPYASAILVDPVYGLPAAGKRDPRAGLLLAYEGSVEVFAQHGPARLHQWVEDKGVANIRNINACLAAAQQSMPNAPSNP